MDSITHGGKAAFETAAPRRRKRRRALLALLLGSSVATLGAGVMSLAVFTDSDASGGDWTTGTIVLGVSPVTTFSASDIMPGDTGSQDVTVDNSGTGALRYSLSSSATDPDGKSLADQLTLTVESGTCAAPTGTLYTGALSGAAFGDSAQGSQAGDRTVAAGASDDLCFTWDFPLSSGNGYQDAATAATFTFDAEQTANNP